MRHVLLATDTLNTQTSDTDASQRRLRKLENTPGRVMRHNPAQPAALLIIRLSKVNRPHTNHTSIAITIAAGHHTLDQLMSAISLKAHTRIPPQKIRLAPLACTVKIKP